MREKASGDTEERSDMQIQITAYTDRYVKEAVDIWNQVVEDGVAFPQTEPLTGLPQSAARSP